MARTKWIKAISLAIFLLIPVQAKAESCILSASEVRRQSPGMWPSWTENMKGHEGTKCWFAVKKERRHDHGSAAKRNRPPERAQSRLAQLEEQGFLIPKAGGSNPSAAAIPMPKPRMGYPEWHPDQGAVFADEFLPPPVGVFEDLWGGVSSLFSPRQRINETFIFLGVR